MREPGDEARHHEQAVVRGDRAQDVPDGERGHQADEQPLARPGRREEREERGTDDDAGRVGGDGVPGRGDVDADAGRDVGEQAHRDELRRADGDAAQDQGEGRDGGVAGLGHGTCSARHPRPHSRSRRIRCDVTQSSHDAAGCRRASAGPAGRREPPGSAQPGPGPPDAEPGQQGRGREVQRRLRQLERPEVAGRLVDHALGVALARQPLEARVDGRGLDRAPDSGPGPRRSSRTARQEGRSGRPSAPSVSLLRTQSPRSAVCTVIDSGWPWSSALIPSRVCALIAKVAVVGATRCGRTHSGTATWTATYSARVTAMAGSGPAQDRTEGDAEDDGEDRVADRHDPAHGERHRRQQLGQASPGAADHAVEGVRPPGHRQGQGSDGDARPPASVTRELRA